ncbi:MAG: N-acetylneuraminate synthase family protein [Bdellovibrionales bacterium]|nr:N-acetylneuraminate synthase family protein [Bdellovibrionales bacterium]
MVKFQSFKADEFVADRSLEYTYALADGTQITESQYDMFKRVELPDAWHGRLRAYADAKHTLFLSSAADRQAVDLLIEVGAPAIKLASEDLINVELLEYVAGKGVPTILSSGMADEREIEIALDFFVQANNPHVILLHCVSEYPTKLEDLNLGRILALRSRFDLLVGLSDHTVGTKAAIAARALGIVYIEKHFTTDTTRRGPDHAMSADPAVLAELCRNIRETEAMLGDGRLSYQAVEEYGRVNFRRSIVAKRDIQAGEVLTKELIHYKRPGQGLKPYEQSLILGKRINKDIAKDTRILLEDLEEQG